MEDEVTYALKSEAPGVVKGISTMTVDAKFSGPFFIFKVRVR